MAARAQRKPTFFWQGVLILLPVAGLVLFGLFSLRRDRVLAEEEARSSSQITAQQMARAIRQEASRQLFDYAEANAELQANRSEKLGLSHWAWANGATPETVRQHIQTWQTANPDIDLSAMPAAICVLGYPPESASPRYHSPRPYRSAPQPPGWLQQLTPVQTQLWEAAQKLELVSKDFATAQSELEKFIATKPPAGAIANAEYLLLLAKTHGMAAKEAAARFAGSGLSRSSQLTDAGLPVGQLICYQALHRMPDGAGLPDNFLRLHVIAQAIDYRPSIFSSILIAETERVARGTPSAQDADTLQAWWESDEKTRAIFTDFWAQHPTHTVSASPYWVNASCGKFLLLPWDYGYQKTNRSNPDISYQVLVLPDVVVKKAVSSAMLKSGLSLPPYAVAEWQIGGTQRPLFGAKNLASTNQWPLLAEASGRLDDQSLYISSSSPAYPFQIRLFLADPGVLYARQRQRTFLFGALVVASAFAALMGFIAASRSFRRQQQLNELKSNFVSSVSHELRAPIAAVRLMAENLEGGKIRESQKQSEYFGFIVQECRRLSALIQNVLDFSRIEQGRKQYELEPTDLVALTQSTVKLMEPYAAEKNVNLAFETFHIQHPTPSLELQIDGRAIQQALVNLMDNAIKHSPKSETVTVALALGGAGVLPAVCGAAPETPALGQPSYPEPWPETPACRDATRRDAESNGPEARVTGNIALSVIDHGPGIPRSEHEKIFERFYRRGSELRRETHGVGIGLSLVKHIVEAHGGRVIVHSEPGQGSRFTIELPVRTQNE